MPTTDDYGQGVQIASLTDAPDGPRLARDLASGIIPRTAMRFASGAERNATLTSPVAGMVAWVTAESALTVYDGSGWRSVSFSTPWVTLALNPTFWEAYGDYPMPRVRRVGDIVYLEGRAARVGGGDIPNQSGQGFAFIGNVPSGFRPPSVTYAEGYAGITSAGTGAPVARIEIAGTAAPGGDYHNPGDIRLYKDKSSHWVSLHAYWHMA